MAQIEFEFHWNSLPKQFLGTFADQIFDAERKNALTFWNVSRNRKPWSEISIDLFKQVFVAKSHFEYRGNFIFIPFLTLPPVIFWCKTQNWSWLISDFSHQ